MNLETNLSNMLVKKSIAVPIYKKKNQMSGDDAIQEQQQDEPSRLRVKRIKFTHPLSTYRLVDRCALQISAEETITPFYIVNITCYVTKVTFDSESECSGLSYHFGRKYPSSSIIGWEQILNALRCGGYSKYDELARAFQILIQMREEAKHLAIAGRSNIVQQFPEFTKLEFRSDYPQLAEVRINSYEAFTDDPLARMAINKKMLSLFNPDSEYDAFESIHLGLKDIFRWNGQNEWISYLTKCFEAYRENLCGELKHKNKEIFIDKLKISFPTGNSQYVEVWSQCVCYSNATVIYYTYYPVESDSIYLEPETEMGKGEIDETTVSQMSEVIDEEKEFLLKKRNEGLEFLEKMYYNVRKTSPIVKEIAIGQDDTQMLSNQENEAA